MALTLTPVPATKPRTPRLTPEEISGEVATAVEEAYRYCKDTDDRLQAAFKTKTEAEDFLHAARSYVYLRVPRLVMTGSVTQKGQIRFRVTDYIGGTADPEDE